MGPRHGSAAANEATVTICALACDSGKAFVLGVANPVMVQDAVFAGITITEGWLRLPFNLTKTGDIVRVDARSKTVNVVKKA